MNFQFASLHDFLMMDGHGPYVWASYLITFIVIVLMIAIPVWQKKRVAAQIKRHQRIQQHRS